MAAPQEQTLNDHPPAKRMPDGIPHPAEMREAAMKLDEF